VLTSLMIVNLAFGVMSRAAPQMNVFAVGFPITLVFGLIIIWYSMPSFLPNYQRFMEEGFNALYHILRIP
jgi:flagellar biosynthetic protein FliR